MSEPPKREPHHEVPVPDLLAEELRAEEMAREEEDALVRQHDLDRKTLRFDFEKAGRKIVGYGMRTIMILVFVAICLSIATFTWHILFPEKWSWLEGEKLLALKSFIFSGAVLGSASNFMRKYV